MNGGGEHSGERAAGGERPRGPRLRRLLVALALGVLLALARRLLPRPGRAPVRILPGHSEPARATGSVRSLQEAEIEVEREFLERIWTTESLELLARGYWGFLRWMSYGAIRVVYGPGSRTVTAFGHLPLLTFAAPRYETGTGTGTVTWPIEHGLLVAREGRGRGHLQVSVRRLDHPTPEPPPERVTILAHVEVSNFYPGIRGSGRFARLGAFVYSQTQLRIHELVCNAYLRSIPALDFPALDTAAMPGAGPEPGGGNGGRAANGPAAGGPGREAA